MYDAAFLGQLEWCREVAVRFVAERAEEIAGDPRVDIVGFSTTFQQNLGSLALARSLKRLRPDITIVFGGANCEGQMGPALHRSFPFLDVVCSGESDRTFAPVVGALREGGPLEGIAGVTWRGPDGGTVTSQAGPDFIQDLDSLPYPDHDDFMQDFRRSTAVQSVAPQLTVETSRGCWWGEKHHCTFCGLNGLGMAYRRKSPDRAYDELQALSEQYGIATFFNTDNILDLRYFGTLFPRLKQERRRLRLYYESKANLKRSQLLLLRDTGTDWLQPGLESLSSHVLALMDKGVRAIQNVQLLRWARELRMKVTWNVICGFPGERAEDYVEMSRLMQSIPHLQPPVSFAMSRLDRFSPMHRTPEAFGLTHVRPSPAYEACYQLPVDTLQDIAYFFTADRQIEPDTLEQIQAAWRVGQTWKACHEGSMLDTFDGENLMVIYDTRPWHPVQTYVLEGARRAVYIAASSVQSPSQIADAVRRLDVDVTEAAVRAILMELVESDLVLKEGDLFLSLALLGERSYAWLRGESEESSGADAVVTSCREPSPMASS
jgi:ribosomal peptide maturation radical SAM protein 1